MSRIGLPRAAGQGRGFRFFEPVGGRAGALDERSEGRSIVLPEPLRRPAAAPVTGLRALSRVERDHVLFWQGERIGSDLELVEGVVRAVHLCENGERQILTFFWPGTMIGTGGGHSASYTAETVTPCLFRQPGRNPIGASARAAEVDPQVFRELVHLLRGISRRCALSRIAWFLLRMREHLPRDSAGSEVLRFVVPRLDMADHLGLSLETVSRCLTELKVKRAIELPNRKTIRFMDLQQLARIANG